MSVVVSFVIPGGRGFSSGIAEVTARETITVPGTTTRDVKPGEMVVIGNAEADMVFVAFGTTPDAQAATKTSVTSAGIPVPAGGYSYPLEPKALDKINVKALA